MRKIREWLFPIGLSIAWIVASAYTLSQLSQLPFVRAQNAAVEAHRG